MVKSYYFFHVKVVIVDGLESMFLQIGKSQICIGMEKMIKRKGNKFYVEIFTPKHTWKLLGIVISISIPDDVDSFVTHFKRPDKHFYIKGLGYPINEELLQMLKNARIEYIIIPEDGVREKRAFLAETRDYLHGDLIQEPKTERQRVIPLKSLDTIDIDFDGLKRHMYG